jgi:uncharacterized membrane protein YeaQ/YmgE (transglycosylase-associated protein family)
LELVAAELLPHLPTDLRVRCAHRATADGGEGVGRSGVAGSFNGFSAGNKATLFSNGGIMGIIAFIILGVLAGAIAKAIMPGADPGGFIVTAIIGIVGALLGGFLAAALFDAHPLDEFFDISTWLTAIVGAIVLLVIYRLVTDRSVGGRRTLT